MIQAIEAMVSMLFIASRGFLFCCSSECFPQPHLQPPTGHTHFETVGKPYQSPLLKLGSEYRTALKRIGMAAEGEPIEKPC